NQCGKQMGRSEVKRGELSNPDCRKIAWPRTKEPPGRCWHRCQRMKLTEVTVFFLQFPGVRVHILRAFKQTCLTKKKCLYRQWPMSVSRQDRLWKATRELFKCLCINFKTKTTRSPKVTGLFPAAPLLIQ